MISLLRVAWFSALMGFGACWLFGFSYQNVRMCFLSSAITLQSQCVLCQQQKYLTAVNGCTRNNILPANITQREAFCMISSCIDNPRQHPQLIGRRRRREAAEDNVAYEVYVNVQLDDGADYED
ncbi:uncharacterized protein LOC100905210 [Galendromus occidentalis]|uniref:Uncharacterized protein LOC100905210 n=1 Tax=Galendromus occidentalis TaxID=34638 RepID=A0AAJ6W0X6_9ACAR|nr:uncharacterized protein LOC100905210 [Galendromus occidentalis]